MHILMYMPICLVPRSRAWEVMSQIQRPDQLRLHFNNKYCTNVSQLASHNKTKNKVRCRVSSNVFFFSNME